MGWTFPYPNGSLGIFVLKNTFFPLSPNRKTRISYFGNKDWMQQNLLLKDHFPSAVTQLMDKPKAQVEFFWAGSSLLLQKIPLVFWEVGSEGWGVQTSGAPSSQTALGPFCVHLKLNILIFISLPLEDFSYPVFSPSVPQRNPWIPSPSPKVPTDKQMYCKRDTAAKTLLFYSELSLVELSSY